jgi:RNA polymerase sigma-70 factor, ECF subfamily
VDHADLDAAVRHLHAAHAPALHAWARHRTTDAREAEEIVQETLILAWRKQDQYDPGRGSERAWLFGIARNVSIDRHRRQQRHLRAVPGADAPEPVDDSEIDRAVQDSHIRDALATLSDAHRQVVVETYYRGRSVREAAVALDIPEGTVKSRLYHALRALRSELERQEVLP